MEPEKKEESEEESIKATLLFNLVDGNQEQNFLFIRPSKIDEMRQGLIKAFEEDGKSLSTMGSVLSPHDFCVIPTRSVISISFVVQNNQEDDGDGEMF